MFTQVQRIYSSISYSRLFGFYFVCAIQRCLTCTCPLPAFNSLPSGGQPPGPQSVVHSVQTSQVLHPHTSSLPLPCSSLCALQRWQRCLCFLCALLASQSYLSLCLQCTRQLTPQSLPPVIPIVAEGSLLQSGEQRGPQSKQCSHWRQLHSSLRILCLLLFFLWESSVSEPEGSEKSERS
jgi:hypothetical protein